VKKKEVKQKEKKQMILKFVFSLKKLEFCAR